MNKVDATSLERVKADVRNIIEKNGIVAEEVVAGEEPEFMKVVRGDLCLEWGMKIHPGNGDKYFELAVSRIDDGWQADICLEVSSWNGACSNEAPTVILDYFKIYGTDNHNDGLDINFDSYEAGLVVIDRLVWAFVNRQPEFERSIRAILDRHGIGTGRRIATPDAEGWQEERNGLFLSWGYLDESADDHGGVDRHCFGVSVSTNRVKYGIGADQAYVYFNSHDSGIHWVAHRRWDGPNSFTNFMDDVADDDIDESYDNGEMYIISRPVAGLELVERLVKMFVDYQP